MKHFGTMSVLGALAGIGLGSGLAQAAVIPIAASGGSSGYTTISSAFDAQPSTDPVVGPTDAVGGSAPGMYNGRTGYIDFGVDFSSVSISKTFDLYKQYGTNSDTGYALTYLWSNATTVANATATSPAPDFGFLEPTTANSDKQWIQRYNGPAVTPEYQYLLVTSPAVGGQTNRSLEWVFVSSVPEPASLSLLALSGLLVGSRRRRAC
jgi:hypothetical protein